jgi:alcohol dehydrogenase
VAVGGGTVIDLAKVVAALLVHGGGPRDYYGENLVPGPVLPLIAVPTTAGTGSEVTTVAVLSDPERELKVGISSVHMVPAFAVCDPQMTYTCPPSVTAFAGIDAVCHAVEAYTATARETGWREVVEGVSIGKNDLADDHALRALAALAPNLPRVVEDGSNRDARAAVMRGATDAGVAFSHAGTAGPHALQYPLGAATKTPHGLGVGLLLPYVLTANRPGIDQELAELAECVGVAGGDPAEDFIEWTVELNGRIGVPANLQEIGVERDQLRRFAELTTTVTRLLQNNPGDNSVEGLERVLVAAWEGDRDLLR